MSLKMKKVVKLGDVCGLKYKIKDVGQKTGRKSSVVNIKEIG